MTTEANRKSPFILALIFILACAVLLIIAWPANSSATLSSLPNTAAPTDEFYAYIQIAKPTYTLIPTQTPTNTPEPIATPEVVEQSPNQPDSAPIGYSGSKHILVDISEQHMYVYDGDSLVYSFVASTGMNNATKVGSFSVLDKIPNAYGATWDLWMPNWLGIYWAGSTENGIHALPILSNGVQLWAGYLGTPISFGCVVIGTEEAQTLYDWAEVGVPVDIQW